MGNSAAVFAWTVLPILFSIGIALFFVVMAIRLVRAVERIADKLG